MSKRTLEKLPTVTRAALAAAASCLFALVLCLLFAAAASSLDDPTAHLSLYGEIIFAVTMLTCGLLGAKLSGDERFLSGMLSGGILLLFVIAASFAFPGGSFAKCAVLCGSGAFLVSVGALLGAKGRSANTAKEYSRHDRANCQARRGASSRRASVNAASVGIGVRSRHGKRATDGRLTYHPITGCVPYRLL